jgi:glycosyltransferase involved in cell wall biosynthesis
MKVLHVTTTDPAGSVLNFVNALNHHTEHRARAINTVPNCFDFPSDVGDVYDGGDEIEALLREADVIHLHKVFEDFQIEVNLQKAGIHRRFKIEDTLKAYPSKKLVCHIHGHPYERENVKEVAAHYKSLGVKVLCSTPDLEEMYRGEYDGVSYFPNCVPINDVRYLPRASDRPLIMADGTERLCVAQSPTHAILKNVHVIENVVRRIGEETKCFYLKIQGVPHDQALRHKRNAHVVFDHMEGYYGLSSLEAMSMGKPTIAGLSDTTLNAIMKFFGTAPNPWVIARDEKELETQLRTLLLDEGLRKKTGEDSRKFMEEVWSDRAIGQRLAAFYQSL